MAAPTYDIDFYSDDFIANPFPHYEEMRRLGPVIWLPQLCNFALPRYSQVQRALRDHETFISSKGVAGDQFGCDFLQGNTVASDEPRHSELRRAMAPPLLPGALKDFSSHIEQTASKLIASLADGEEFDAVSKLARHLPFTVVRDLVGLPEFAQDKMLKWAGAAFDVLGMQNERGQDALEPIKEMRDFIQNDATPENLKPGSWTNRINELVNQGVLPCEHAAYAIRDYINPSLDTTISATSELIFQLAQNPDQLDLLRNNPKLIKGAVNEAVRLGTPIRSFSRHTSRDVEIDGVTIPAGARVMMLFASANRDDRQFENPDQFDVRRPSNQHLGFGSGIHMCVGMHLAQLEMEALIHALVRYVDRIDIGTPEIALNNTIRAYSTLPCKLTPRLEQVIVPAVERQEAIGSNLLNACVEGRRDLAQDIIALTLAPANGTVFPKAEAGAHIDVHVAPGIVRQYSLTGEMVDGKYVIAVQKDAASKGGSVRIHEKLHAGSDILIGKPRNNFQLDDTDAPVLLVAGGIGITPLVAMAWELYRRQRPFKMLVFARNRNRIAFADELSSAPFAEHVTIACDDEEAPFSLHQIPEVLEPLGNNTHVYLCGPIGFMEAVQSQGEVYGLTSEQIHLEHFGSEIDVDGEPFTLHAKRSNKTLQVPSDQTILKVLSDAGFDVETSCENGVCGSCLTAVIEGTPDHRDMVQTDEEKAKNNRIAVCCSRSKSKKLVLDI